MKVLMFGWEFPPHITGGLGTACYGLTKALSTYNELEIIFVVPKAYGDEDASVARFIGADRVPVVYQDGTDYEFADESGNRGQTTRIAGKIFEKIKYLEMASKIRPYISPEEYDRLNKHELTEMNYTVCDDGRILVKVEGREIEIFAPSSENQAKKTERYFKFSGSYGSGLLTEVANYAKIAAELAKNEEFDIIHAHDWLTYLAGVAAKHLSGKKLVIHVHATEFDRTGENVNQMVYDIERYGIENADKIITVSNLTRQTVINRYGAPENKVETVHNGVMPFVNNIKEYPKNKKEKVVTFLGRITYQKGPEYFVEAASKVLQKTKNVKFVMAGSGDLLNKMIRRVAALKIADNFHFTNFLKGEEVDHMFGISDVYVMPSVSEPFGISPLEAMRSNVPVIISKQSGVAEVLRHAIKVDFWDIDALADSIYGLISYNGLSKMFRRLGKKEADSIKWEKAASKIKDIYFNV
jgi:glycogen synthase